jgi:rRNA maturation RNase YbeY
MKYLIEINNLSKSPLRKAFFEGIFSETCKKAGVKFPKNKVISLSIALVGAKEIKEINRKYRKINKATDVLSFAEYKTLAEIAKKSGSGSEKELFLGELILCYDDIVAYARKEKLVVREEVAKVISHGILHLLGFKHGSKMFSIQNSIIPTQKVNK